MPKQGRGEMFPQASVVFGTRETSSLEQLIANANKL